MSKPAPGRVAGIAFGAAVMTALAQLGLASGLAVLIWRDGGTAEWAAHLSWTSWLTAVSTVVGGFAATRAASDTAAKVIAIPAAGIGGFIVAPLVAIPAMRFADSALSSAPFIAAAVGSVVGMVFAAISLASRAVAINVAASIALTWLLAGLAAFVPIGDTGDTIRPGVWGSWRDMVGALGEGSLSVAPPLLLGSLLIGAATALIASDSGGDPRITAVSGAVGPLLLVIGYASAGQSDVGVSAQWSGIWTGVYAVVAGLLGSLLVAALRRPPATAPATTTTDEPRFGEPVPATADTAHYDASATETVPAQPVDPYVSSDYGDYDTADDWSTPQPARADEDRIMPPAPRVPDHDTETEPTKKSKKSKPSDETESWVSDLKDENTLFDERDESGTAPSGGAATDDGGEDEKPKKKRRLGRKKKTDD